MKIAYVNLNVGSAIEYYGSIINDWINETGNSVSLISQQGINYYDSFKEITPDLIILNELFSNVAKGTLDYIKDNPLTRLIVISHVWKDLLTNNWTTLFNLSEKIVILNMKPENVITQYDSKLLNRFYPTPNIFSYDVPWEKRQLFCYVGNILPHKLSVEFIQKIQETNLCIDCYGKAWIDEVPSWEWSFSISQEEYYKLFLTAIMNGNLNFFKEINQLEVPKILNNYKFFVLPHDGYEPFNATIMQAIFSGTIPLIVNDRTGLFDGSWVDWCRGLHYETNDVNTMLANMLEMTSSDLSTFGKEAQVLAIFGKNHFNYEQFKQEFIGLI